MSTAGEISGARGKQAATYERHVDDFYIEPRWCVDALLNVEDIPRPAWDPACGSGTIPTALRARGIECHASDAADRGFGRLHDFLGPPAPDWSSDVASIVCNPPYGIAQEFAEMALSVASHKVALLVQAKFCYSQRRNRLFTSAPVSRLYFLSDRPSMPPGDAFLAGEIKAEGGKMDFLWVVFEHGHVGPPTAHWLRKGNASAASADLFGNAA